MAATQSDEQQLQELTRRFNVLHSLQKFDKPGFTPNPDDIIIAMPPKNGLTWMLNICDQIHMHGAEPDFEQQENI